MVIIRILFIIAYYLFVLSPGRRVVGAWHVAALSRIVAQIVAQRMALFVGRGGPTGTPRATERRAAEGAAPTRALQ